MEGITKSAQSSGEQTQDKVSQAVEAMKKKPMFLKIRKFMLVLVSIFVVLLIWGFFIGISIYLYVVRKNFDNNQGKEKSINYTNTSLMYFYEAETVFENIFNISHLEVTCPPGFTFRGSLCDWKCGEWHPIGFHGIKTIRALQSLIVITGIILSIITFLTFILSPIILRKSEPKVNNKPRYIALFDSLPILSTFFVIVYATIIIVTYAIIDFPHPGKIYCDNKPKFRIIYDINEPRAFLTIFGIVYQFSIISFFIWIINTLINILLILFFPIISTVNAKFKRIIFIIECAISIIIPLSLVVFSVSFGQYVLLYVFQNLELRPTLLSNACYTTPYLLCVMTIVALIVCVICKLRWIYLSQWNIASKGAQKRLRISSLEYKMTAYASVCVFLYFITTICFIRYITVATRYFELFYDELICITLSAPLTINGTQQYATSKDYILAQQDSEHYLPSLEESCNNAGVYSSLFPAFVFMITQTTIRITFVSAFIIILPSKDNYLCWKKIVMTVFSALKTGKIRSTITRSGPISVDRVINNPEQKDVA